jgi:hypothetical protein
MADQHTDAAGTAGIGPGDVRDAAKETIDSVCHEASGLAGLATEQGKSMLSRQKDTAAKQVDSVAEALPGTARQLEGDEQAAVGLYVGCAAERLQSLGRQLREKDVDALIHDAQDLGRRAPGTFFAGSVVAAFLLARFLKASSERAAPRDARRDAPAYGADRVDPYGDEIYGDEGADLRSTGDDGPVGHRHVAGRHA